MFFRRHQTHAGRFFPCQAKIDWSHPLSKDISFFRLGSTLNPVSDRNRAGVDNFVNKNAATSMIIGSSEWGPGMIPRGGGAANDAFYWASNNFQLTSSCSVFAFAHNEWSESDSVGHMLFSIGDTAADTQPEFMCIKYTTNTWFFGYYVPPTDYRVIVGAGGTLPVRNSYVIGGTDTIGGTTTFYVNGSVLGTHASAPSLPNTAHDNFAIGGRNGANYSWDQSSVGSPSPIHWVAVWDRVLRSDEVKHLSANPYCFLKPVNYTQSLISTGAGSSVFRRTLSPLGTRIGSRQVHRV